MNTHITTIATVLIFSVIAPDPWRSAAHAERLSRSNSPDSTLQSQCDLCWTPSPNGQGLDRLPTHTPHRPPHPPGSRPHRFPKGRYKLAPSPTHPRVSSLRSLSARNARLLRGYAVAGLEDQPLWHERDISHSSVERMLLPDATSTLGFMLDRTRGVIEKQEAEDAKIEAGRALSGHEGCDQPQLAQ